MFKSVLLLTKLQICNLFGLNEARFAQDPKKKKRVQITLAAFVLIGVVLVFYAAALSYALANFGFADTVPLYLSLMSFAIIFGLSIFRAGTIFDVKSYEKLAVLPVPQSAIVASKFLSLYVTNFLFSFVVMTSGAVATAVAVGFDLWYLISMILSSVFLPLMPITFALMIGSVIYAVVSRFKRNNFLKTFLACIFVFALIALPSTLDTNASDMELIGDLATLLSSLGNVFLPLTWLGAGTRVSGIGYYFLFVGTSVVLFAAYSLAVGKFYKNICSALSSKAAGARFEMSKQKQKKPLFALYKRELKRYVSSSIYFMNTCMGNILALLFSIAVLFVGAQELLSQFGVPMSLINAIAPFLLALVNNLSPLTACVISMEGKGWEQTKSLPVSSKTVMDAKLLLQFTFSIPTSLLSSLLFAIALHTRGSALVWLFVIPVSFSLAVGTMGLLVNAKNPCLSWDNDTVPVKQSSSTLLCMLVSLGLAVVSAVVTVALGQRLANITLFALAVCYLGVFLLVYKKLSVLRLNEIDEK